jgi:hypothetical protein
VLHLWHRGCEFSDATYVWKQVSTCLDRCRAPCSCNESLSSTYTSTPMSTSTVHEGGDMQADRESSNSERSRRALILRADHGRARCIRSRLARSRMPRTFARICFDAILRVLYMLQQAATRRSGSASPYLLMLRVFCTEGLCQWR